MKLKTIYIDMDGVLARFVEGVCQAHGRVNPYDDLPGRSAGNHNVDQLMGLSDEVFWGALDTKFWACLNKYTRADEMVCETFRMVGLENVYVLTSPPCPTRSMAIRDACMEGKTRWIESHYPELCSRLIFSREKHEYATPESLLIDDHDKNVDQWIAAKGHAILVPRAWNRHHAHKYASHTVVMDLLKAYKGTT